MPLVSCFRVLVWLAVCACVPGMVAAAEPAKDPRLNDTGFVQRFDGKSLKGWHVSAETGHSRTSGNKSGGKWVVEDGAIVGSQDVPGNGGIILTDDTFEDFEVIVEMQNDFGPDSGLFLRSTEKGQAYQYMIDYHSGGNLAGIYGEGLPGGLHIRNFDFRNKVEEIGPTKVLSQPSPVTPEQWPSFWKHGEWNQLRARIVGNPPTITTWINGVKFLTFHDTEKRHANSGRIALQVHGGGDYTKQFVRYRNIAVKVINDNRVPAAGLQVFQKFTSKYAPSEELGYQLFLPQDFQPKGPKQPVMLFLHGAGESGADYEMIKIHGPPKLVEERPADFPFIVVSPQAPVTNVPGVDRWQPRILAELVDEIVAKYNGDPDRLYVTGLSMGGFGTIRLCAYYPKKFAAAIPVCGGGWSNYGEALAPVPMWFFHGDADAAVQVERSIDIVRAMRSKGGQPRLTIYDGVQHDSWTATYNNPEIYAWLLKHKLSERVPLKK